ncbi:MAG: YlmC/YmxH family sporulation protein [Bacillota bacterium]
MKRSELRLKEVININNGQKLGYIEDIDIDVSGGKITAVILPENENFIYRLFSSNKDIVINWENIKVIGDDVVLVDLKQ